MHLHVKFIIIVNGETDGVLERYIGRIPEPGEHVSFPKSEGGWERFKVLRIGTFLATTEPHYNVEIVRCS